MLLNHFFNKHAIVFLNILNKVRLLIQVVENCECYATLISAKCLLQICKLLDIFHIIPDTMHF